MNASITVKIFGEISLCNGGKLEESEGPNCFFHRFMCVRIEILTQRAYIGDGEKSCFILQQIHWAETRDII